MKRCFPILCEKICVFTITNLPWCIWIYNVLIKWMAHFPYAFLTLSNWLVVQTYIRVRTFFFFFLISMLFIKHRGKTQPCNQKMIPKWNGTLEETVLNLTNQKSNQQTKWNTYTRHQTNSTKQPSIYWEGHTQWYPSPSPKSTTQPKGPYTKAQVCRTQIFFCRFCKISPIPTPSKIEKQVPNSIQNP